MESTLHSVVHTQVFGISATGGNPCPVVFNADNLSDRQMRLLSAKFNSETAFVLVAETSNANIRLRYFVPNHEMEMCVHATVGTLAVLFQQGKLHQCPFLIETSLGVIQAHWQYTNNRLEVLVDQFTPTFFERNPTRAEVACALCISETEIPNNSLIQSVSTSRSKLMVPINDWQTLDQIKPNFEELWRLCDVYQTTGFYPFTLKTRDRQFDAEARQFPKRVGYDEDPATGVAACALGAYLTRYSLLQKCLDRERNYLIGQGSALGKDSRIRVKTYSQGGKINRIQVGGSAVVITEETLAIEV